MRRPLRRLAILLALLALLGVGWNLVGGWLTRRAAAVVADATRDWRRQAELLPVGGVLWAYQRSYAPLVALRDGRPVATPTAGVAGEKPMRRGLVLPAPEATLLALDIPAWYARPLADRWGDYASPAWRPIRLGTRGLWLFLGAVVAGGALRAAGRGLLAVPRALVAPLRFLVLFVLRPELTPGTTPGRLHLISDTCLRYQPC